jgi:hypothetical protein
MDKPLGINNIYGDFGFYSMLRTWIGTEPLSCMFYDEPALIHECLEFLEDHTVPPDTPLANYDYYLEQKRIA